MAVLCSGLAWAAVVFYLLFRALRQFRAYSQAIVCASEEPRVLPSVSIIVPARNEIQNIELCLAGLRAQTGLSERSTISVVDDESEDGTAAVVARYSALDPKVRLVFAGVLPQGWTGKPHACWRGALLAGSEWLCFIDADVRAAPQLVSAAVAAAEARGLQMLSLHPFQELGSFWERTIMPAGMLVLACAKPFRQDAQDVVNGQFLLIRWAAYFQIGGHSAVRGEIAEDKALAQRVARAGFNLQVLAAESLARTRMYRNLAALRQGLSRQAPEILGGTVVTLTIAAAALAFGCFSFVLPPAVIVATLQDPSPLTLTGAAFGLCGSAVVIAIQLATARHLRIPAGFGLTFAVGYAAVACLACNGVLAGLIGRVTWKGRVYRLAKTTVEGG
jgi:chlorobactene glucosyltransferase